MKRALVLSGGGSRGAYEIGAWQALEALGVRFDGVYGTSIGALNAALFAQGDLEGAVALWSNITVRQIMAVEDDDFSVERMIANKRDVIPFLMENAKHFRMDISPLEALARERLDEGRIRARGLRLGVMATRAPQLTGAPMLLEDMKPGSLADWVIASASCFPIFPVRVVEGQRYIDGGYYDNLPVDMALADGMDEVVAVELHPEHTHPEYARMPWLRTIRPLHSLGGFLDFNPDLLRRSRLLGYQDVMKLWGRLDGFRYAFRRVDDLAVADGAHRYMEALLRLDGELIRRGLIYRIQPVNAPLLAALQRETGERALGWKDVWLRGLELCAEALGQREDAIYDAGALIRRARAFCEAQQFAGRFDEGGLLAARRRGSRALMAFVYQKLAEGGELPPELFKRLGEMTAEVAGAVFLREGAR